MLGSSLETGARAAPGMSGQMVPANAAEKGLTVRRIAYLWGDNGAGQLGTGQAGGNVPPENALRLDGVTGMAIGNGYALIIRRED